MEIKYLYPYRNLNQYLTEINSAEAWKKHMVDPFWGQISEWAGGSCDFMKPSPITDKELIETQVKAFEVLNLTEVEKEFSKIIEALPKDDEDPMTVAYYPSDNNMNEGVFGLCVWGNIIININPLKTNFKEWIPFVFAHEYHHCVLGSYWYCTKGGSETKGNFLEYLINEGEADEFAKSMYPEHSPSWHNGVSLEYEREVWSKLKSVLQNTDSPQDQAPYMFGSEELGIPPYAGYYFGSKIVRSFREKHTDMSFSKLIMVPHQEIFEKSEYANW